MTDPAERFIEAAVRPLADNAELQMMASQELRAALENAPEAAAGASLDEATEKLEKAPPKERWKVILYTAALLATILAAIPVTRDYLRLRLAAWTLLSPYDPPFIALPGPRLGPDAKQRVPSLLGPLTSPQKLLLFGDLSQPTEAEAMRRLWESSPSDPALFAYYARACAVKGGLPVDFLTTADRLDSQNAWFRYLAADVTAYKAVESTKAPYHVLKRNPNTPRYRILNPAAYAETLRLFEEASLLPQSNSYRKELLLRRLAILPPGDDVLGRKITEAYLATEIRIAFGTNHLSQVISARAEELAHAGDREGFQSLAAAWETFAHRYIKEGGGLASSHFVPVPAFARAARMLGLESHADRYTRIESVLEKRKKQRTSRSGSYLQWKDFKATARTLETGTWVENPPPVGLSDVMPGIMASRAAWQRMASAAAGLVMLAVFLLAAGGRFMRGFQVRRLSASLVQVLDSSDQRRIILGGVIVPFLIYFLVEWAVTATSYLPAMATGEVVFRRFGAIAAAVMALPAVLASRLIGSRLARLALSKSPAVSVAVTAVVTSFAYASGYLRNELTQAVGCALVLVVFAVMLINLTFGVMVSRRQDAVQFLTWARSLLPAYATGLLLFALLVPFHHAREKHWTKLNVLDKIEPGVPAASRYVGQVEAQLQKELLEILDAKP